VLSALKRSGIKNFWTIKSAGTEKSEAFADSGTKVADVWKKQAPQNSMGMSVKENFRI
jgi:hypothetical protein